MGSFIGGREANGERKREREREEKERQRKKKRRDKRSPDWAFRTSVGKRAGIGGTCLLKGWGMVCHAHRCDAGCRALFTVPGSQGAGPRLPIYCHPSLRFLFNKWVRS